MGLAREKKRFRARIEKTTTCWLWTGAKSRNGYGTLRFNGRLEKAHRVAWQLRYGPIPSAGFQRLQLAHACGVRSCVRPDHLRLVPPGFTRTGRSQNVTKTRGRPRSLTAEKVNEIRDLLLTRTDQEIASMFSVSTSTIRSIKGKRTWRLLS